MHRNEVKRLMEQEIWEFFNALDSIKIIANHYGLEHQLRKCREELTELCVATIGYHIGENNKEDIQRIVTEIADVEIMTAQLKYLLDIKEKVNKEKVYKINRQLKRMESEE